jgi:hypothetical protein
VDQDEYLGAGLCFQDYLEIQNLTRPSSHAVRQSLIKWGKKEIITPDYTSYQQAQWV